MISQAINRYFIQRENGLIFYPWLCVGPLACLNARWVSPELRPSLSRFVNRYFFVSIALQLAAIPTAHILGFSPTLLLLGTCIALLLMYLLAMFIWLHSSVRVPVREAFEYLAREDRMYPAFINFAALGILFAMCCVFFRIDNWLSYAILAPLWVNSGIAVCALRMRKNFAYGRRKAPLLGGDP